MNKTDTKNISIIGFAIFAMFFGAGNLIFPPYLGLLSGTGWFLSFLCFIIMDIGLSLLALLVVTRTGKGTEGITEKLGKLPSILILSLNAVCLGPLIAIPRTAATAYEFSIAPFFPAFDTKIFSLLFFLAVVLFCLSQSKVIDIIGTVFAPLILAALLFLIVKGIVSPLGAIELQAAASSAVRDGINAGCLTPAIGLLSSFASFFEKQTKGKVSYRTLVFGFAGISYVISNFGITRILALASPILNILYPVLVLLVIMGLMEKWLPNAAVYRSAASGTIVVSTLSAISEYLPVPVHIAGLPLYEYGFQWVLPAAICGIMGYLFTRERTSAQRRIIGNIAART